MYDEYNVPRRHAWWVSAYDNILHEICKISLGYRWMSDAKCINDRLCVSASEPALHFEHTQRLCTYMYDSAKYNIVTIV